MSSPLVVGCRSNDIQEFCSQAEKSSDMDCAKRQGGRLLDALNRDFRVRNVEICAVLFIIEVDLQMLRNCVFRQRKNQIWAALLSSPFANAKKSRIQAANR